MNYDNFRKWLEEWLIPNLPAHSVIVLDNAPYHSKQRDRCPTIQTKKGDIQDWLRRHQIPFPDKALKAELLEICKRKRPPASYIIYNIIENHGHECIRLPPYHADLNAIELIWANIKQKVACINFNYNLRDIIKFTEESFAQVTRNDWESCCAHVEGIEKEYWEQDIAVEEEIEKIEFLACSSDESTDTASEGENSETDTADEC